MNLFLPEGLAPTVCPPEDAGERLLLSRQSGLILEGQALCCTAGHDLLVSYGGVTGRIPRTEAALGIAEGVTKEIAILSRVGKPVCFTVTQLPGCDNVTEPVFSRCAAQRAALHHLSALPAGSVLPAVVTRLEPFGAFLDVGCGVVTMLGLDAISVARIRHPSDRFRVGQQIYVVLRGVDLTRHRVWVSHKELLGTWAENAARFTPGMTVTGRVCRVKSYGIFVELLPNLSGLAEPQEGVKEGDRVSVFLKAIQPERQKIKLLIIDRLPPDDTLPPLPYTRTSGVVTGWQYGLTSPPSP